MTERTPTTLEIAGMLLLPLWALAAIVYLISHLWLVLLVLAPTIVFAAAMWVLDEVDAHRFETGMAEYEDGRHD